MCSGVSIGSLVYLVVPVDLEYCFGVDFIEDQECCRGVQSYLTGGLHLYAYLNDALSGAFCSPPGSVILITKIKANPQYHNINVVILRRHTKAYGSLITPRFLAC